MIEHYWTVLCRKGVIDSDSNNISLLEVLEQVNIVGTPPVEKEEGAIPGEYEIVSLWGRANYNEPARGMVKYVIGYRSGDIEKTSKEQIVEIDMTGHNRSRSILKLPLVPIHGEGLHRINVSLKIEGQHEWREVTSLPYEVRFQPPQE